MKIRKIVANEIRRFTNSVIRENSLDRNINKFIKSYFDGVETFGQARDVLMSLVYKTIPDIRYIKNFDALVNVIKYFFAPNGQILQQEGRLDTFKYVLHFVVTTTPKLLTELENTIAQKCDDYVFDDVEESFGPHNFEYEPENNSNKVTSTPNGYTVYRIDSKSELNLWDDLPWCVARDSAEFLHGYVGDKGTAYVCSHDGEIEWTENENEAQNMYDELYRKGDIDGADILNRRAQFGSRKFPYDNIGLHDLFVIAWPDGRIDSYSSWNLSDENGKYLTREQLSQVLGIDARKVCVPIKH